MSKRQLQEMLEAGLSLAVIGERVGRDASTVGYWVRKHGLEAANRERHAPRGGLTLEQLQPLIDSGVSHRAVALKLGVSQSTVRHWVQRHGLVSRRTARLQATSPLRGTRPLRAMLDCPRHGVIEHRLKTTGSYRCPKCSSESVSRRRRRIKAILVEEAGGSCTVCRYDRYVGALEFHHLDRESKLFAVGHAGMTRSIATAREEAAKCVLLCANCHAEVEAGIVDLQSAVASGPADEGDPG